MPLLQTKLSLDEFRLEMLQTPPDRLQLGQRHPGRAEQVAIHDDMAE